jgi:hypothetical protein
VVDEITKTRLKSMARQYDEVNIRTLGAFASNAETEPHIKLEAIKILFDRGHGRPKGDKKLRHTGADGKSNVIVELVQFTRGNKSEA